MCCSTSGRWRDEHNGVSSDEFISSDARAGLKGSMIKVLERTTRTER